MSMKTAGADRARIVKANQGRIVAAGLSSPLSTSL
jgi:hypothetical protein